MQVSKKFFISILKLCISWRLLIFIPIFFAVVILPYRATHTYTQLSYFYDLDGLLKQPFLSAWANFDGVHYINIATRGYVDEGRFLPLYPILIKNLSSLFFFLKPISSAFVSGFLISLVSMYFSCVLLFKLVKLDFKDKIAFKTTILLFLLPASFFFAAIYTESLFLLLTLGAFYAMRTRRWLLATFCIMLASIARLPGILLIIPLVHEMYVQRVWWQTYSLMLLTPLLILMYSWFNFVTWGDPLYFVHAHSALGNSRETSGLVFPLVTVWRYVKILFTVSPTTYDYFVAVVEFLHLLIASAGVLYISWLSYKGKMRTSYVLFTWAVLSLPVLSGTLSGFPRYMLVAFPLVVSAAYFADSNNSRKVTFATRCFLGVSVILQVILLGLFARGYFVA